MGLVCTATIVIHFSHPVVKAMLQKQQKGLQDRASTDQVQNPDLQLNIIY